MMTTFFEELGKLAALDKVGLAGVTIAILYFGFKMFQLLLAQWKLSTEAVNRNSKSFEKLSAVFERQTERELEFQKDVMLKLDDTHKKVGDIHGVLILKRS